MATSFAAVASLQSLIIPVLSTIGRDLGADAVGVDLDPHRVAHRRGGRDSALGRAGDLLGRRRMYILALAAVSVGSVVAAFAPTLTV